MGILGFDRPTEHSQFDLSITNAQSMTQSAEPVVHANLCPAHSHIYHTRLSMIFMQPMTTSGVLLAACLMLATHSDCHWHAYVAYASRLACLHKAGLTFMDSCHKDSSQLMVQG